MKTRARRFEPFRTRSDILGCMEIPKDAHIINPPNTHPHKVYRVMYTVPGGDNLDPCKEIVVADVATFKVEDYFLQLRDGAGSILAMIPQAAYPVVVIE